MRGGETPAPRPGAGRPGHPGGRRSPVHTAAEHAGAEVEDAFVLEERPVAHVEQLVVDEQSQQFAVGDVQDGLAGLRVAVRRLGIRQRPDFVEPVEVRAGQSGGLALVEVAAQADVAVGEGEQRLALGEHVEAQLGLAQHPRLDAEGGVPDHPPAPPSSSSSARSFTTMSPPRSRSASACPTRSTPPTTPNHPARPAPPPAPPPPNTAARSGPTPTARAPARNVSGAGLPFRPCSRATLPSTISSNRSMMPAASSTSRQFVLDETTARRSPASRAART